MEDSLGGRGGFLRRRGGGEKTAAAANRWLKRHGQVVLERAERKRSGPRRKNTAG